MKIDPDRLSSLRKKNRLTRLELEKQSGINKRTIQRLESKSESQRCQKSQEHTVNSLAKALGVEAGVLTGDLPLARSDKAPPFDSERVQIGAQIVPKVRLAYDLIKRRYHTGAAEVISMAPLFFTLLAEGSLAWRREKIEEAEKAKSRLEEIDGFWRGRLVYGSVIMDEGIAAEENSISKADLFGEHLFSDTDTTYIDVDNLFDPSIDNPFASYLRKLQAELAIPNVVDVDSGDLRFGSPLKFPDYDICRDELDGIANGSHYAKVALETGDARLSEIPEELMAEDAGEERAKWLEDKLSDTFKELMKEKAVLLCDLLELGRQAPEGDLEKLIIRALKARREKQVPEDDFSKSIGEWIEKWSQFAMYEEVLLRSGISDPDGALRKRIEEYDITNEELDRLLAGAPLEEADSQETNPAN